MNLSLSRRGIFIFERFNMSYLNNAESIKCNNCQEERASICDAIFYDAAMNLHFMVRASENIENDELALGFASKNKRAVIDVPLIGHLASIGCTLSEAGIQVRLQQEVESL